MCREQAQGKRRVRIRGGGGGRKKGGCETGGGGKKKEGKEKTFREWEDQCRRERDEREGRLSKVPLLFFFTAPEKHKRACKSHSARPSYYIKVTAPKLFGYEHLY